MEQPLDHKDQRCGSGRPSSTSAGLTAEERASAAVSELTADPSFWGLSHHARGMMRRVVQAAISAAEQDARG